MLETVGIDLDEHLLAAWRTRVERARAWLGWPAQPIVVRRHAGGTSLALAAPVDQLFTATEINEWALCAALGEREPERSLALERALATAQPEHSDPAVLEEGAAMRRLARLAAAESRPHTRALIDAATSRELPVLLDEESLTLGAGVGSRSWAHDALPDAAEVPWLELHDIPTVAVTGSNGKTTTVRLVAACARAHGWHTGYNCTDGLFVDDEMLAAGDYSGPVGSRSVLRDRRVEAAVLETARGGILRRGLAVARAKAAVVTNVSADHFGEYGIHDLESLAEVKLVVAQLIGPGGLLILNADDPLLRDRGSRVERRLGWFSLDDASDTLRRHRARGGSTCGPRQGHLWLSHGAREYDLGPIDRMPLSVEGRASYNLANLAGAALAAVTLGIAPATIADVFGRFGANARDNPGRLMRFEVGGLHILMDYAHNPDGLRGLLRVAEHLRGRGRMALLLGQAGNREDEDVARLAAIAAEARPDLVVVKEMEDYRRGRAVGEVAGILHACLRRLGLPDSALPVRLQEVEAARCALEWAQPGDVLVLLVHSLRARADVASLIEQLSRCAWLAGQPLPP